jgi:hypothetical protein
MKTKNIFLIAFLAMAVISCKQLVQIVLPEDATNSVIEGQISNQLKPWSVTITKSQAFNDQDSASAVSDAVVIISDDAGNVDTLVYGTNGKYRTVSSRQCVPGRIYTLEVFYDNQY